MDPWGFYLGIIKNAMNVMIIIECYILVANKKFSPLQNPKLNGSNSKNKHRQWRQSVPKIIFSIFSFVPTTIRYYIFLPTYKICNIWRLITICQNFKEIF